MSNASEIHQEQLQSGLLIDGRYRLIDPIGNGPSTAVWKAHKTGDADRPCVLKFFETEKEIEASIFHLLQREFSSLTVQNANLVTPISLGLAGKKTFLVLPLVEGSSLRSVMTVRDTQLRRDEGKLLDLFLRVVKGVVFLHKSSFVHLDIVPENLFVAQNGSVLISDFGINRIVRNVLGLVRGPHNIIHKKYASPERFVRISGAPTDDIFSLGVLFYELASGMPPWEGRGGSAIVDEMIAPASLVGAYSDEFLRLVLDCLDREPQHRPTANELESRIRTLLASASLVTAQARSARERVIPAGATALSDPAKIAAPRIPVVPERQPEVVLAALLELPKPELEKAPVRQAAVSPDTLNVVSTGDTLTFVDDLLQVESGASAVSNPAPGTETRAPAKVSPAVAAPPVQNSPRGEDVDSLLRQQQEEIQKLRLLLEKERQVALEADARRREELQARLRVEEEANKRSSELSREHGERQQRLKEEYHLRFKEEVGRVRKEAESKIDEARREAAEEVRLRVQQEMERVKALEDIRRASEENKRKARLETEDRARLEEERQLRQRMEIQAGEVSELKSILNTELEARERAEQKVRQLSELRNAVEEERKEREEAETLMRRQLEVQLKKELEMKLLQDVHHVQAAAPQPPSRQNAQAVRDALQASAPRKTVSTPPETEQGMFDALKTKLRAEIEEDLFSMLKREIAAAVRTNGAEETKAPDFALYASPASDGSESGTDDTPDDDGVEVIEKPEGPNGLTSLIDELQDRFKDDKLFVLMPISKQSQGGAKRRKGDQNSKGIRFH